jgi:hypothetical protein
MGTGKAEQQAGHLDGLTICLPRCNTATQIYVVYFLVGRLFLGLFALQWLR